MCLRPNILFLGPRGSLRTPSLVRPSVRPCQKSKSQKGDQKGTQEKTNPGKKGTQEKRESKSLYTRELPDFCDSKCMRLADLILALSMLHSQIMFENQQHLLGTFSIFCGQIFCGQPKHFVAVTKTLPFKSGEGQCKNICSGVKM